LLFVVFDISDLLMKLLEDRRRQKKE